MSSSKYKDTICPVCGEFYFSPLTAEDIEDGDNGLNRQCRICGWKYDIDQLNNPSSVGINTKSIEELKQIFLEKRNQNARYLASELPKEIGVRHKCPVCDKHIFKDIDSHEICPICGWEDDQYSEEYPDKMGGANDDSLTNYKKKYLEQN